MGIYSSSFSYVYHISYLSYRLWTRLYTDGAGCSSTAEVPQPAHAAEAGASRARLPDCSPFPGGAAAGLTAAKKEDDVGKALAVAACQPGPLRQPDAGADARMLLEKKLTDIIGQKSLVIET